MNGEVVKDMTDTQHTIGMDAEQQRSVQEISQLFDLAGRESEVIAGLTGGMDQLRGPGGQARTGNAHPSRGPRRPGLPTTMQPGPANQSAGQPSGRPAGKFS